MEYTDDEKTIISVCISFLIINAYTVNNLKLIEGTPSDEPMDINLLLNKCSTSLSSFGIDEKMDTWNLKEIFIILNGLLIHKKVKDIVYLFLQIILLNICPYSAQSIIRFLESQYQFKGGAKKITRGGYRFNNLLICIILGLTLFVHTVTAFKPSKLLLSVLKTSTSLPFNIGKTFVEDINSVRRVVSDVTVSQISTISSYAHLFGAIIKHRDLMNEIRNSKTFLKRVINIRKLLKKSPKINSFFKGYINNMKEKLKKDIRIFLEKHVKYPDSKTDNPFSYGGKYNPKIYNRLKNKKTRRKQKNMRKTKRV